VTDQRSERSACWAGSSVSTNWLLDRRIEGFCAFKVRAFDQYERNGDLVVERTYEGSDSGRSTWTIYPVDEGHSTLTIDASQKMGLCGAL
jgi:hypothetical protein